MFSLAWTSQCGASVLLRKAGHAPRLDKRYTLCENEPMTLGRRGHVLRAIPMAIVTYAVTACGERDQSARFLGDCDAPTTALVPVAMDAYLESVRPPPRRFLIASGTDSALPAAAEGRLQRRGPTYIFPADPALQSQVLSRLDSLAEPYGDVPTLLVTYRGVQRAGEDRAVVRIGGYFLGGANDGTVAHRSVQFVCDTARWNVVRAEEERQS
jgi:hypothetical protein